MGDNFYDYDTYYRELAAWIVPSVAIFSFVYATNQQRYLHQREFWSVALLTLPIVIVPAVRCGRRGRDPWLLAHMLGTPGTPAWRGADLVGLPARCTHRVGCGPSCLPEACLVAPHGPGPSAVPYFGAGGACRAPADTFYSGAAFRMLDVVLGIGLAAGGRDASMWVASVADTTKWKPVGSNMKPVGQGKLTVETHQHLPVAPDSLPAFSPQWCPSLCSLCGPAPCCKRRWPAR